MTKRIFTPQERKNQNLNKYRLRKKNFRLKNKKIRNNQRSRNYLKSRPKVRHNWPWFSGEDWLIMSGAVKDRALAECLERSVQAIQQRRYVLNRDCGMSALQKTGVITTIDLGLKLIKPLNIKEYK